jgi:ABC-type uncharacterized transport system substrate-binding protein
MTNDLETAARAIGQPIQVFHASNGREIDTAFATMVQQRAIYPIREFALAGGLISYGISQPDVYRQVEAYAGRILKGEKPANLPVVQPSKFEFVINLNTATAFALDVPAMLLARADEVIE